MFKVSYSSPDKNGDRKSLIYKGKNGTYFAVINKELGYWKIYNAKSRGILHQGTSNNWNVIRRRVRKEFVKLGVKLLYNPKKKNYHKENGKELNRLSQRKKDESTA